MGSWWFMLFRKRFTYIFRGRLEFISVYYRRFWKNVHNKWNHHPLLFRHRALSDASSRQRFGTSVVVFATRGNSFSVVHEVGNWDGVEFFGWNGGFYWVFEFFTSGNTGSAVFDEHSGGNKFV